MMESGYVMDKSVRSANHLKKYEISRNDDKCDCHVTVLAENRELVSILQSLHKAFEIAQSCFKSLLTH